MAEQGRGGQARRDARLGAAGAGLFSLSLGIASIAVPLLAVRDGYGLTEVGVLVAVSAVGQMITRLWMGALMRRMPDKVFVASAAVLLAISCVMIVPSSAWPFFACSQTLQGVARGLFWTGTQTHAVRVAPSAVAGLARVNLTAGVGQFGGPVVAGLLAERSAELALLGATFISAATVVPALLLTRLPPFAPRAADRNTVRLWRQPGVNSGCWAAAAAGLWQGLLGSYVPVLLQQAGQSPSAIGALITGANATFVAGSGLSGRAGGLWVRRSLLGGALLAGSGVAATAVLAGSALGAALALAFSGLGAGALTTLGPAVASDAVHHEERGDVIATTGTFRAAALFLAPVGVAGMVLALPLTVSVVAAGFMLTLSALTMRRADGRPADEPG